MINENYLYKTVAEAVNIKFDTNNGDLFLVFKITDENLKNKLKKDWSQDIELQLIGKKLILKE